MFQTKIVKNVKLHILYSVTFFYKIVPYCDNVEKHSRAGEATGDNMVHAHFMLSTYGYKHTPCLFENAEHTGMQ